MIDNETDSEGEQNNFIDNYDEEGKVRSNSSKSRNRSFNASKRSMASRGSKLSKKSNIISKAWYQHKSIYYLNRKKTSNESLIAKGFINPWTSSQIFWSNIASWLWTQVSVLNFYCWLASILFQRNHNTKCLIHLRKSIIWLFLTKSLRCWLLTLCMQLC